MQRKYPLYTKAEIEAMPTITFENCNIPTWVDMHLALPPWDLNNEWCIKKVEAFGHRLLYKQSTGEVREEILEEYSSFFYVWEDIFYDDLTIGTSVYIAR